MPAVQGGSVREGSVQTSPGCPPTRVKPHPKTVEWLTSWGLGWLGKGGPEALEYLGTRVDWFPWDSSTKALEWSFLKHSSAQEA
jgi:hypothetical protein